MAGILADQILVKQPAESRRYEFDFSNLLAVGETVTGVTSVSATPTGLTIASENVNSDADGCTAQISVGTDGTRYTVVAVVTTSDSNTLEGQAILLVKD